MIRKIGQSGQGLGPAGERLLNQDEIGGLTIDGFRKFVEPLPMAEQRLGKSAPGK